MAAFTDETKSKLIYQSQIEREKEDGIEVDETSIYMTEDHKLTLVLFDGESKKEIRRKISPEELLEIVACDFSDSMSVICGREITVPLSYKLETYFKNTVKETQEELE